MREVWGLTNTAQAQVLGDLETACVAQHFELFSGEGVGGQGVTVGR